MTTSIPFPMAIDSTTPCKLWLGAVSDDGYGVGWFEGRLWKVHRYAEYKKTGSLTTGLDVCHTCNNKICWEPEHLYQGTRAENMAQATRDGLTSKKLTPEQVRAIRELFDTKPKEVGKTAFDNMLAKQFQVSRTAIYDIRAGRAWRNLP